jgi:hypothetical protein
LEAAWLGHREVENYSALQVTGGAGSTGPVHLRGGTPDELS